MYTVILVEDEENLNTLIKAYLEKAGYKVICYLNGEDAIANINQKINRIRINITYFF